MSLDEQGDRILLLEKRNQELEHKITSQYKDLEELRHANSQLSNRRQRTRLAPISPANSSGSSGHQPTSLYNEIEMSSSSSIEDELRAPFAGDHHDGEEDIDVDDMPFLFEGHDDNWKVSENDSFQDAVTN